MHHGSAGCFSQAQCSILVDSMSFNWERDSRARWERSGADSDGEKDYGDYTQEEAAEELANLIIELKLSGILSARNACIVCFWAARAGVEGRVAALAKRPDTTASNCSRHFHRVAGCELKCENTYDVLAPGHSRAAASRITFPIATIPPLGALKEELDELSETGFASLVARRKWDQPHSSGSAPFTILHCALSIAHCALRLVHWVLRSGDCRIAPCALCMAHCIVHAAVSTATCDLLILHCACCLGHCPWRSVQSALPIVHCG